MKKTVRTLIIFTILFLTCSIYTTSNAQVKGDCGNNATYVDDGKGNLLISGRGIVNNLPKKSSIPSGSNIKKIVIEEGITAINFNLGDWIYLSSVEQVSFPSSIESIGTSFAGTSLTSIKLPEKIEKLDNNAFKACTKLKSVDLGDKISELGEEVFSNCTSLESITIPVSVTKIGKNVLQATNNLLKVVNNSKVVCPLPTCRAGGKKLCQTFYQGKKKVKEVKANTTVVGKWNSYKVTLKLNGGKLIGKKINKHVYNTSEKLPKAKKKGYKFFGWAKENDSLGKQWPHVKIQKNISKKVTYKAIFKKVKIQKKSKKIYISLEKANIKNASNTLYVKYGKNKVIEVKNNNSKAGIKTYYNKKKDKATIVLKKKKKIYVYWWQSYDVEDGIKSESFRLY